MKYVLIGLTVFVIFMIFALIIYFKDVNNSQYKKINRNKATRENRNFECCHFGSKYDEKTGKFYPVLNGDISTANVLVTLPDGSKGWTDGLGNGYIR